MSVSRVTSVRNACLFQFVLLLLSTMANADDAKQPSIAPSFLRIGVVDTSGSMAKDGRLDVAKSEMQRLARDLPPSVDHPFVIIPFESNVLDVRTFTELATFEAFLGILKPTGGTNIAAGLEQAVREVERYRNVPSICVLLYTDGEDGSQNAIFAAESKLDALFADREKRGLGQSVVFCKRWQQANSALVQRIADHGHAQLIDAGELKLIPITYTPELKLIATRWTTPNSGILEINLEGSLQVATQNSLSNLPDLTINCLAANSEGDTAVTLTPGANTLTKITVRVPIDSTTLPPSREWNLSFAAVDPKSVVTKEGVYLPAVDRRQLSIPITVPENRVRVLAKVTFAQRAPGQWVDPVRLRAEFPVSLEIEIASADGQAWNDTVSFAVTAVSPNVIAGGTTAFDVQGTAAQTVDLTVIADTANAHAAHEQLRFPVSLVIRPTSVPQGLLVQPDHLRIDHDLPPPPRLVTRISAKGRSVGKPVWVELPSGRARAEVELDVTTSGPVYPNAKVGVTSTADVSELTVLSDATLRAGRQSIRVRWEAVLPPAPQTLPFQFTIRPPAPSAAIEFQLPSACTISVPGPTPVQLSLIQERQSRSNFLLRASDSETPLELRARPIVVGGPPGLRASGLQAVVQSATPFEVNTSAKLAVNQPSRLPLAWKESPHGSFFLDERVESTIDVRPFPETPAVAGSRQNLAVIVEAPFKRLAFNAACILAAISAVLLMFRVYAHFSRRAEL